MRGGRGLTSTPGCQPSKPSSILTGRVWMLDIQRRELGLTINCSSNQYLQTQKYHITLINTPGLRDYTKNMIRGTVQADV